jgi:hypothetical protein
MRTFRTITSRRWMLALAAGALAAVLLGLVASAASGQTAANTTYRIAGVTPVGPDQRVMLSVANVSATTCSARLSLVDQNGLTVARASVSVPSGQGAAMTYAPPPGGLVSVRPVVVSVGDSCTTFQPSTELIDGTNQTAVVVQQIDPIG